MTHITPEELDTLARLCSLELTPEQKEKFLWQLDRIVDFVSQLDECPIDEHMQPQEHPAHDDTRLELREGVASFDDPEAIVANAHHPIERRMIVLKTSTHAADA